MTPGTSASSNTSKKTDLSKKLQAFKQKNSIDKSIIQRNSLYSIYQGNKIFNKPTQSTKLVKNSSMGDIHTQKTFVVKKKKNLSQFEIKFEKTVSPKSSAVKVINTKLNFNNSKGLLSKLSNYLQNSKKIVPDTTRNKTLSKVTRIESTDRMKSPSPCKVNKKLISFSKERKNTEKVKKAKDLINIYIK